MATLFGKTAGDWGGAQAFTTTLNGTDYAVPGTGDTVILNNKNMTLASTTAVLASLTNAAASGAAAGGKVTLMNNGFLRTALLTPSTVTIVDVDSNATNAILEATTINNSTTTANIHAVVCGVNQPLVVRGVADVAGTYTGGTVTSTSGNSTIFQFNSTQNSSVKGSITGGSASYCVGLRNNSSGAITITGAVTGGSGTSTVGVSNVSSGTITITGAVTGGDKGHGVAHYGDGTLNITGNVTGGVALTHGVVNYGLGTMNIYGTVTGGNAGYGAYNYDGTLNIEGDVYGGLGSTSYGVMTYATSNGPVNITGSVIGSASNGVHSWGPGTITIIGNVIGGSAAYGAYAQVGAINITGNVYGGGYSGAGNGSTYLMSITGSVTGGSGDSSYGVKNTSTGGITVGGTITAGSGISAHGVYNTGTGTITANGTVTGGPGIGATSHGVTTISTGIVIINANCVGTPYGSGVYCETAAEIRITGNVTGSNWSYGDNGSAYPGLYILGTCKAILHGNSVHGTYGVPGYIGYICRDAAYPINSITVPYINTSTQVVTVDTLYSAIGMDAAVLPQHIRAGYEIGDVTGTLVIPPAASVAYGVAVDDTTGLSIVTAQNVRDALKLAPTSGTPATGSIDELLISISNKTANIPASPAAVGSPMVLSNGSIGSSAFDNSTAFPLPVDQTAVIIPCTVDDTVFTSTTTEFECSNITEETANHYKRRLIVFTSGILAGQLCTITAYAIANGKGHFTVTALTEAPPNGSTFTIY